jgi:hypothetical protein
MTDVDKYFEKQMESPEFRSEWEALQPERAILEAPAEARKTSIEN